MPLLAPPPDETRLLTAAELGERFGGIPAWRIRTDPAPGTATEEDVQAARRDCGLICELVDGTLVEKVVSEETVVLELELGALLRDFVKPRRLGWVAGATGFVRLYGGDPLRAPDASFIRRDQRPHGLARRGFSHGAPALCVEVFSPSNTRPEMERKRTEYFDNGCELCWTVYDQTRTVEVHTPRIGESGTGPAEGAGTVLTDADTLTGDPVLPGFAVPVAEIFDALELT